MKRYVIIRESSDESGQRGVDAVYAGPGEGWGGVDAGRALEALKAWLDETRQWDGSGTRLTIVPTTAMPDSPRGKMAAAWMEAEASRATHSAVIEDVDPPVTELHQGLREAVRAADMGQAFRTEAGQQEERP